MHYKLEPAPGMYVRVSNGYQNFWCKILAVCPLKTIITAEVNNYIDSSVCGYGCGDVIRFNRSEVIEGLDPPD